MRLKELTVKNFMSVGNQTQGLNFDQKQEEGDRLVESNGIKVLINKKSFLYLAGTTLNYFGGLNGKGFVFENPNANRTCGCGESFSL